MEGERVEPTEQERRSPVVETKPSDTASSMVVQAKMLVGAANDSAEREADRVARNVVASLRRGGAGDSGAGGDGAGDGDLVSRSTTSRIRRASTIGAEGGTVDRDFESRVRSARGTGTSLPAEVGEQMQRAFGSDFSSVRLHSDARSHALNRTIQARAFTTGSDIFLGQDAPSLASTAGTELLAHELTHVVQQGGDAQRSIIRREFIHGSAEEDAELFDKEPPVDKALTGNVARRAAELGITEGNMGHYLERHTFKYQKLNAKTVSPGAGFFPYHTDGHRTTVDDVEAMLEEALTKLPDGTAIGQSPVSVSVDLSNGLRVNVGALKNGKLAAFFPVPGGSHPGFHAYTSDELKQIRAAKNTATAAAAGGGGGTP